MAMETAVVTTTLEPILSLVAYFTTTDLETPTPIHTHDDLTDSSMPLALFSRNTGNMLTHAPRTPQQQMLPKDTPGHFLSPLPQGK